MEKNKKLMKKLKTILPFIAAIGVFFLASNSPMWKQMVENEIKSIPVKEFK